ncbi:MAG: aldo/keto reductase [Candidatus Sulfotelmatobacter sp.]
MNEEESEPFFRQAIDLGINFFDTANVYSGGASEEVLGRFLKANIRREAVVIATKVHGVMRDEPNGRGLSRKAIFYELDQSLRRCPPKTLSGFQRFLQRPCNNVTCTCLPKFATTELRSGCC